MKDIAEAIGEGKVGEVTLMLRFSEYTLNEQLVGAVREVGEDWERVSFPLTNPPMVL